jgi:hypothetical protein
MVLPPCVDTLSKGCSFYSPWQYRLVFVGLVLYGVWVLASWLGKRQT